MTVVLATRTAPLGSSRSLAVKAASVALRGVIEARATAAHTERTLNWKRLPESFRYRAEVRRALDNVCAALAVRTEAAQAVAALYPVELFPLAHEAWTSAAQVAWSERMKWATLRSAAQLAGY
jgi:hypothetical protein